MNSASARGRKEGIFMRGTIRPNSEMWRIQPKQWACPLGDRGRCATLARMIVRTLGRVPYGSTVEAMREFTARRDGQTPDELWLCEHDPVYTQGIAGSPAHVLDARDIP